MKSDQTFFHPFGGASQVVGYTASSGDSLPVPARTTAVWVWTTTDAFVRVGGSAQVNLDFPLPAFHTVVLSCDGNQIVSARQISAPGTLYVAPIA